MTLAAKPKDTTCCCVGSESACWSRKSRSSASYARDGCRPERLAGGAKLQGFTGLPTQGGAGPGGLDGPFGAVAQRDLPAIGSPAGEVEASRRGRLHGSRSQIRSGLGFVRTAGAERER